MQAGRRPCEVALAPFTNCGSPCFAQPDQPDKEMGSPRLTLIYDIIPRSMLWNDVIRRKLDEPLPAQGDPTC